MSEFAIKTCWSVGVGSILSSKGCIPYSWAEPGWLDVGWEMSVVFDPPHHFLIR